ncbi:response regulator [candidate division GN15 bacterium]|uniref:Response regulator n=1 Tax=candidate division GN15 bacterium TaxID=2072418 RepID=A0A855X3P2_9BACT|nr:MAG: response regulator [candidate division GN15 bacterium]
MSQTILVVDDSPTIVKFVSFSLRNSGFEVVAASDGMDAIEKMSHLSGDVDLVITDLNMPNLDGYGLIGTLRQNERYRQTPIIILSSEDGEDDRQRGMEVGANAYLVKPFKSALLLDEVGKFLKK